MDSIKINLKFWLAGLIAGVILVERWRRYGGRNVPAAVSVGGDVEASSEITAQAVSTDKPKVSVLIVTGAKADAERVRRLLGRAKLLPPATVGSPPSTSTSA
jgi:hypothetical protein